MEENQHEMIRQQQIKEFYNPFVRKRTENWCRQDTLRLINLWKTHVRDLKGIKRNYYVYQKLAAELSKFGVKRSPREVKTKIANLAADYRKEQCKIRMGTTTKSSWKFWKEVDEVFNLLHVNDGEKPLQISYMTPPHSEHSITIVPLPNTIDTVVKRAEVNVDKISEDNVPILSISDVRSMVEDEIVNNDDNSCLKILNENSSSYDNSTVSNLATSILSPPGTSDRSDSDNREVVSKKYSHTSPDRQCRLLKLILEEQRRTNEQFARVTEKSFKLHLQEFELHKRSIAVQERIAHCMEKIANVQPKKETVIYPNVIVDTDSSNDDLQIDEQAEIDVSPIN